MFFNNQDALDDLEQCVKQASLYLKGDDKQVKAASKFIAFAKDIADEIKTYAISVNFDIEPQQTVPQ